MRAMILAAGLGTRMAPLSDARPKPALPILDEPMILHMVRQLASLGMESVVVNTHAHPDLLARALEPAPIPVHLSHEPELLGSAGGIRAARRHLEDGGPFLVMNADMRIELELASLLEAHAGATALATLLLRDDPRHQSFGSIGYDRAQRVCRVTDRLTLGAESGCGLFTGVQVMSPEILAHIPDRPVSQLMSDVYVPGLERGATLVCVLQDPRRAWWPVGSPAELLESNLRALHSLASDARVHPDARVDGALHPPVWIGARARVPADATLGPHVVVGADTWIPPGLEAHHCLFLPGARPLPQAPLAHAVAFDQEVWRRA